MNNNIIQTNIDKFQELLNDPKIKHIMESNEFYFQKVVDKYNEYISLATEPDILNLLIEKTKEKPFSFKNLLDSYNAASEEGKIIKVIGELISYILKLRSLNQSSKP